MADRISENPHRLAICLTLRAVRLSLKPLSPSALNQPQASRPCSPYAYVLALTWFPLTLTNSTAHQLLRNLHTAGRRKVITRNFVMTPPAVRNTLLPSPA